MLRVDISECPHRAGLLPAVLEGIAPNQVSLGFWAAAVGMPLMNIPLTHLCVCVSVSQGTGGR